jgi:hypothetical protein
MSGGHLSDHGPAAGSSGPTGHHGPATTPDKKTDDKPASKPDPKVEEKPAATPSNEGASVTGSRTEAATHCRNGCCSAQAISRGGDVNVNVTVPHCTEEGDKKPAAVWGWVIPVLIGAVLVLLGLMVAHWTGALFGVRGTDTGAAPRIEEAVDPVKEFGALEPVRKDKNSEAKSAAPAAGEDLELIVDNVATRVGELQTALHLNREEDQSTLALAQETAKKVEAVTGRVDQLETRAAEPAPPSAPIGGAGASNPQGWSDVEMGIARRLISRLREIAYYDMNPGHETLRAEAFGHAQQEEANWQRQSRRPVPSRGELDRVFPVGRR